MVVVGRRWVFVGGCVVCVCESVCFKKWIGKGSSIGSWFLFKDKMIPYTARPRLE